MKCIINAYAVTSGMLEHKYDERASLASLIF